MMADLAFIFHWSLRDMEEIDLEELKIYHALAQKRFEIEARMHGCEVKD
jgi:hypothetical protein